MTAITRRLSEFVAEISHDQLPAEVRERAKLLVADHVGIAVRARQEAESTPSLLAAVRTLGLAQGAASVVADVGHYSPPGAALINGTLAHSLDFDDTHARGSIHPSAPIVPAALAAAEMTGANGREVIAGIVAGYEVQIRLSLALVPKDHYDRGFHPTATCGVFGAAAAAARVFGLPADQVANAFGICLSQAAGSMQYLLEGAWTKRFHVGYAAMNGLIAASFAREGFKGAVEAIEGKAGFLKSYAPNPIFENATARLGEVYETMAIAVKPYPCCRYSHAAIDALVELRATNDIDPEEIKSVEVGLPHAGWKLIGDPEEAKQRPQNVVDGQFSMPFLAAVTLREGGMNWDHYARHLGDADTLSLCKRVRSVVDPQAEAEFPAQMSGVARVRTPRALFEKFVAVPKGEPENFLMPAELRAKFDGLVAPYLSEGRRDALTAALLLLEQADDISAVLRLTRPDRTPSLQAAAGAG
ncbi:MAG: MmgE/PrpD family protein [Woeseia sp.]